MKELEKVKNFNESKNFGSIEEIKKINNKGRWGFKFKDNLKKDIIKAIKLKKEDEERRPVDSKYFNDAISDIYMDPSGDKVNIIFNDEMGGGFFDASSTKKMMEGIFQQEYNNDKLVVNYDVFFKFLQDNLSLNANEEELTFNKEKYGLKETYIIDNKKDRISGIKIGSFNGKNKCDFTLLSEDERKSVATVLRNADQMINGGTSKIKTSNFLDGITIDNDSYIEKGDLYIKLDKNFFGNNDDSKKTLEKLGFKEFAAERGYRNENYYYKIDLKKYQRIEDFMTSKKIPNNRDFELLDSIIDEELGYKERINYKKLYKEVFGKELAEPGAEDFTKKEDSLYCYKGLGIEYDARGDNSKSVAFNQDGTVTIILNGCSLYKSSHLWDCGIRPENNADCKMEFTLRLEDINNDEQQQEEILASGLKFIRENGITQNISLDITDKQGNKHHINGTNFQYPPSDIISDNAMDKIERKIPTILDNTNLKETEFKKRDKPKTEIQPIRAEIYKDNTQQNLS